MKKRFMLLSGLILSSSLSFGSTLTSMTNDQLKHAFINKTLRSIATDNLNGQTIENTFSMFLDDQGHIVGQMAHKPKNQPQTDTGVYTIKNDGSVYLTWKHWDDAKELCAQFFETKNAYLAVSCDHIFHTAFMKETISIGNNLK